MTIGITRRGLDAVHDWEAGTSESLDVQKRLRDWIRQWLLERPDDTEALARRAPVRDGDPLARFEWVGDVLITFYVWRYDDGSPWVADVLLIESLHDL